MPLKEEHDSAPLTARFGALCYAAWGLFHCKVALDIWRLGAAEHGLAQGRLYQLAAYMLTIALFVLVVGLWRNWRNDRLGYWLNLIVAGWADSIWVAVVVLPGYVDPIRGFVPPAIFAAGALLTSIARRISSR
ncbi:hypothetical protein AX777_17470 [Sphingobium yanoikuyae]|jgi:hypothetical protein|uniref:Uncharacterized protein n=1 Tax=Sphingobium yanoikuyae TaxID=13690 RepID=A0A177JWY4_SPHYA|nr:hypothetical protein [Sphingobium yanoikuyae]OAH45397.1 hypothetical protein AX777_17470 [Sphingobium yanoikuyae]